MKNIKMGVAASAILAGLALLDGRAQAMGRPPDQASQSQPETNHDQKVATPDPYTRRDGTPDDRRSERLAPVPTNETNTTLPPPTVPYEGPQSGQAKPNVDPPVKMPNTPYNSPPTGYEIYQSGTRDKFRPTE